MKTTKYALVLAVGLMAIAIALVAPRQAQANALTLSPAGFGVGASVCSGPVNPISGQNFKNGVSSTNVTASTGSASADLSTNPLTMGLKSIDTHAGGTPCFSTVTAAEGYTVLGAPASATFTINGTFAPGNVDSSLSFDVETYANAAANKGITAGINFVGNGLGPSGWEYSVNGSAYTPYLNGTPIPLNVPISSADMGIIVSMSGEASGDPNPYIIDFLDPITISFTPAPGGEVDLATGQKFFGPSVGAPEPSSLLLLCTGLLGLMGVGLMRRKHPA